MNMSKPKGTEKLKIEIGKLEKLQPFTKYL